MDAGLAKAGYFHNRITALVLSRMVATEPVLVSCHRATRGCSAATVVLSPTKNVGTAFAKFLVTYKVQNAPIKYLIYDSVDKRVRDLRTSPYSSGNCPSEISTTIQKEVISAVPPLSLELLRREICLQGEGLSAAT